MNESSYLPDSPYRPERIRALLAACLGDDPAEAVAQVTREQLWDYLASEACATQLGGTLLHVLNERSVEPPVSTQLQFRAYSEHVANANAYKIERTVEPLRQLQRENIPFLLLKGAALNAMLYPTHGMRNMVDVDVLIQPENAARADRALKHAGCRLGPALVQDDFYPRFYYEREYFTPHFPPVKIDLHVQPFRPLRYSQTVPREAMWDQPLSVSYGPLQVHVPHLTHLFIHLATHAACHGCPELRWLYDLKLLLQRYGDQIDVEGLIRRCRDWRINLAVHHGLRAVQQQLGGTQRDGRLNSLMAALRQPVGWADQLALYQSPRNATHPLAHVLVGKVIRPVMRFLPLTSLAVMTLCTPGILRASE